MKPLTLHTVKRWTQLVLAFAPVFVGGCMAFEPSDIPDGAVPLEAPAHFGDWWARTEQCSGLFGPMEAIRWYVVPEVSSFDTDIGEKVGLWIKTPSDAVIVLAEAYADHELVVRHEMLHQLLQRAGHPEEYFVEKCGLTWNRWHNGTPILAASST
ncbi:MAG: hypothetical protein HKM89_00040 [Gemmatimonadales bacterium]|nr:hypothetical protein [Gemmatimonadales bacterium]